MLPPETAMSENAEVVIFRKWKKGGPILALFPEVEWDRIGNCMSYEHVGQHGGAHYGYCISVTVPATTEEYAPLLKEMQRIGYNLKVKTRR